MLPIAGLTALAISAGVASSDVFSDFRTQRPGMWHHITAADLPQPFATPSVDHGAHIIPRPDGAMPQVPAGFSVAQFATGFQNNREIRTAPNGDIFVAESEPGRLKVMRGIDSTGKAKQVEVFADGLNLPFGIAFYPPGPNPKYIYVGNTDSVWRFPYKNGDLKATGPKEVIVSDIPGGGHLRGGGHWTRDIAFSPDGKRMFVSVGSHSNIDDPDTHPEEFHRADILEFTPAGKFVKVYAWGIRNPVGITIQPETGQLWCSTNERDALGDNLVPDYITHVQEGGFYGWPWYYTGSNQDPRLAGKHPELKSKVIVADVLLQPHNASLEMLFYEGSMFPAEYKSQVFAAEHGSWNRDNRTGYEVIRAKIVNNKATGEWEDFMTGFVTSDGQVWGRPVGVAVMTDGSLLVSDDGTNSIWRVTYTGK
jgi:glucose/arabinose dehydrogenase